MILHKFYQIGTIGNLIAAVRELECQLESEFLDIEFALDEDFQPYLFQVRSITTYPNWNRGLSHQINAELNGIQSFIRTFLNLHTVCMAGRQSSDRCLIGIQLK